MFYRILADGLVVVHCAFILFVVLGGVLALRWQWIVCFHLPAAFWGAFVELSGRICPLTPLENQLRTKAGEMGYSQGFIEHYLHPVLYPAGLTQEIQTAEGVFVILVNLVVYWRIVRAYSKKQANR